MPNFRPLIASLLIIVFSKDAAAATKKYSLSGKLSGSDSHQVLLIQKNGSFKSQTPKSSGAFSFKNLTAAQLKGATLHLIDGDGRYAGPVVLAKKGNKAATAFNLDKSVISPIALGKIVVKSGYASLAKKLAASVHDKIKVTAPGGKPVGAGEMGLVRTASPARLAARVTEDEAAPGGVDSDLDGLPDALDADDDGDLVLDSSDPDSAGTDVPYTSLFFDFRRTLNSNVRDGLTAERVNSVVAGENSFALTFFFSLPQNIEADGGHIICDDSLTYCRQNTPLAFYGGVSESTSEFRNHPWSELLNSDGYPRMEKITLSGGFSAIVASIQPRVNAEFFRPGDVYRAIITNEGREVSSRSLVLPPYFVSIPAIKEYNAGSGAIQVDYGSVTENSGSIPGVSESDPIVLSNEGALTLTFWRPQRPAIRSDESGYYDWGNLHYGLIVDAAQATCGGLYSSVSGDLTEDTTPLGAGDSPLANQGANLAPYTDAVGDRAANSSNTLTFTVNLKNCLARSGGAAGIHRVTLSARGEDLTGGNNAAGQVLYVQIP